MHLFLCKKIPRKALSRCLLGQLDSKHIYLFYVCTYCLHSAGSACHPDCWTLCILVFERNLCIIINSQYFSIQVIPFDALSIALIIDSKLMTHVEDLRSLEHALLCNI